MNRYSIFALARNAFSHHESWQRAWRSPEPRRSYDVLIVGGGGHGLATAYYLATAHGIRNVAVLERGRPRRKFRRLGAAALGELLGQPADDGGKPPRPDERESAPPTALAGGSHEPPGPDGEPSEGQ